MGRDIHTLEPDVDARVSELLDLMRTCTAKPVDFAHLARYFVLDVLSTVAFGRPFGFMAANDDLWGYNQASNDYLLILGLIANHRPIRWLLSRDWIQKLVAPKTTDTSGLGPALAFAHQAVAERFGPDAKVRKDLLGSFVQKGLPQVQCEVEAFLQIMAGSDSSTTILRTTIFLLAGNPRVYARLRADVDAIANLLPPSTIVPHLEAIQLPYLKATIWECLRLFPPLFGLKAKTAPPEGDEFDGVFYPGGTEVAICDDAIFRRKDVFGDDADIFRPERFLQGDDAAVAKRWRTVDVVFGSGRFQCLGKHMAMMELHKAIFEVSKPSSGAGSTGFFFSSSLTKLVRTDHPDV
jgi:cytochrome P450